VNIIILGGPAKSGKSTLASRLQEQYQFSKRFYRWEANPDGEGFWTSVTQIKSSQQKAKKELFSRFAEIINYSITAVRNLYRLGYTVVVSLGGLPSPENERFIKGVEDLAPVLCILYPFDQGKLEAFEEWIKFAKKFDVDAVVFRADLPALRL